MAGQLGFWSITERLAEISAQGDPLETLAATVDFEMFRPVLEGALGRPPRWKGGRPPFDPVLKFRMLVLQSLHGLSLEQTEYLVRDRLSWMRFCQIGPEDRVPDADTLWDFREGLIAARVLEALFARLDRAITAAGYLPRGGQILDATLVAAPRQRNTDGEKAQIREGRTAAEIWPDKPARARQKDVDGRWTVKYSKAKLRADGSKPIDIAIPVFGYKSHISIDRMHGVIRRQVVTDAARHDGARLREGLIQGANTARDVWADSAYRSVENEAWLADHGMTSRIHRKKPRGRPMPKRTSRANAAKSALRSKVEHVFAHQKARMRLTIRTIGIARAEAAITLANMAYNMTRWRWLNGRAAAA
ncbi:IS5 family transposase [Paracoccus sp. S-4012]|uniref:IS5 family transposase n=1 Tax=Paracoccus sp. S-4012 TaxID=2665648 RepID=UPI0012B0C617|nr:IS5 family transposase [Paracoccus sp. S-4012]MRX50192.1 IS5 family transposase [Paracoccus sp. S-4012]